MSGYIIYWCSVVFLSLLFIELWFKYYRMHSLKVTVQWLLTNVPNTSITAGGCLRRLPSQPLLLKCPLPITCKQTIFWLLSPYVNIISSRTLYKWNHSIYSVLISGFSQYSVLEIHPGCLFLFIAEYYFIVWIYHNSFVHCAIYTPSDFCANVNLPPFFFFLDIISIP